MKVSKLIEQLEKFDPELEVHFAYNYGDHWRTTVAPKVKLVDEGLVAHSAYHNMPMAVETDEDSDEDNLVVILR